MNIRTKTKRLNPGEAVEFNIGLIIQGADGSFHQSRCVGSPIRLTAGDIDPVYYKIILRTRKKKRLF